MTIAFALDIGLAVMLLAVAAWTLIVRKPFSAVIGFVAYGLLLALVWVRLASIDIALTEAAIGSGLTGALLLRATARGRNAEAAHETPSTALRVIAAFFCAMVSAGLAALVLLPAIPAPTLAPAAGAGLPATGLGNPVTAVLLAYRAVDTFLEKVVVLLALVGVWSLAPDRCWGGAPTLWRPQDPDYVLGFLAQVLPPIGIMVAIYILWNGANHPGGAFQASAMLAAMWMLTVIAGLSRMPRVDDSRLRLLLVAGAMVFLLVGLAGFTLAGAFLAYPPGYAKALIIAIEVVMTLSVAITLVLLVAGPPRREASR
jgi:multisubunit Na+/H+ antiporter MnhB subunit